MKPVVDPYVEERRKREEQHEIGRKRLAERRAAEDAAYAARPEVIEAARLKAEQQVKLAEAMAKHQAKIDQARVEAEIKAQAHKLQSKKDAIAAKFGVSYDSWLAWARSLYPIDMTNFTVISHARNWKNGKAWTYNNEYDCLCKIEELVDWKEKDRDRNRGSKEKDLASMAGQQESNSLDAG